MSRFQNDEVLVAAIKEQKELNAAVRYLYESCFDTLSRYILNNSGSEEDAEDLFQEVLLRFINLVQQDKFRAESSVKTFLYSLNRFAWLNELKRRGRSLKREEVFESEKERATPDAEDLVTGMEQQKLVTRLLDELGDTCKKILLLFYYESQSIKEILETLPYENEQVVRNKKYKCLKELEKIIHKKPVLVQALKNILHGT